MSPASIARRGLPALALVLAASAPAASLPRPARDAGPVGARQLWHTAPGEPLPEALPPADAPTPYRVSGRASGGAPWHTAVEDSRTGEVVGWIPMFPGRHRPEHVWAQNQQGLPRLSMDPDQHPEWLAHRIHEMDLAWPGAWAEQDAVDEGVVGTAFLPLPARVTLLRGGERPRYLVHTADDHRFAWEVAPVRAPEAEPYPPSVPVDPGAQEARVLWQRQPTRIEGHEPPTHYFGGNLESAPEAGWFALDLCGGQLELRAAADGRVVTRAAIPASPHWTPGTFTYHPEAEAWILRSWQEETTDWRAERWVFDRDSLDLREHRVGRTAALPATHAEVEFLGSVDQRRRLAGGNHELVRDGATLRVQERDTGTPVGPPMADSPWGIDLVADPTDHYAVTGAPLPDGSGRAAVWDLWRGVVVAWLPVHATERREAFGWARGHGLVWGHTRAETMSTDAWVPDALRGRALPLADYPDAWNEFEFPDAQGRLRTALLPWPVQVAPLPAGPEGPRFATLDIHGVLTAWEVPLPAPVPGPPPPPPRAQTLEDPPPPALSIAEEPAPRPRRRAFEVTPAPRHEPRPAPSLAGEGWLR